MTRDEQLQRIENELAEIATRTVDLQVRAGELKIRRLAVKFNVEVGTKVVHRGRDPWRRGTWVVGKITQHGIYGYKQHEDGSLGSGLKEIPRPFHVVEQEVPA